MASEPLLAPAPDPLVGKTLAERYRVVRKLGEGGMGAVYEGEHLVIKKRVAIKILHPQFATTPEVVARFHQEALAATAIGHEHIVEVNDMGRTPDGALFMVLEYLQGRDFAKLLETESPLPIGRVAHIVCQICDAVQAAHDKGIVHRDLKPENVYLIKRGGDPDFAKVLDFGISKMKDGGNSHHQTKTGAVIGTAYYMAPEQAMGKKSIDHRADIWAIGVILYSAITGRFPFEDEAYPMLIVKICSETPARPAQLRSDIPAELDRLILRCLEKDPEKRPGSCAELITALGPMRSIATVLPGTRLSAPAPTPASGAPRSRDPAVFAATVGVAPAQAAATPAVVTPVEPPSSVVSPATAAAAGLPSAQPRSWIAPAALVVLALGAGGAGVWFMTRAPEPALEAVAPPTETSPEPVPSEPPPPPAVGHVSFVVSPSEAVVLVDGRPVIADGEGNVQLATDVDDAAMHELRVEARGFRSRVEDIRLSYPQRVVISLDPGTGVDDRRASAAVATGTARRSTGGTRAAGGSAATTATSPAAGGSGVEASATPPASGGGTASGGGSTSGGGAPTVSAPPPESPEPPADPTPEGVVAPPARTGLRRVTIH